MERLHTIEHVSATAPDTLELSWSNGQRMSVSLKNFLKNKGLDRISSTDYFLQAAKGEWGHSVVWPGGEELGADSLWRLGLLELGRSDTVSFLDWRMRHALSLADAAKALGISRRMVAYYSSGTRRIPLTVQLACKGWESTIQKKTS